MKAKEIRDMSSDAIQARLNDVREELMKLKFQQATGELSDTSRLRQLRQDIARLMTIYNERVQAENTEGAK